MAPKKTDDQVKRSGLVRTTSASVAPVEGNKQKIYRLIGEVDRPMLIVIIALICIGSIMVFSSSYAVGEARYGDSYYFARKQILWVCIGIAAMIVVSRIDYGYVKTAAYFGYIVALAINFLVPLFGVTRGGATRWYEIMGIQFQPSELLKFFLVLAMARYISEHHKEMRSFKKGILPLALMALPSAVATLSQSHLSATIIILLLMFTMMWLSGTKGFYLGVVVGVGATAGLFFLTVGEKILAKIVPQAFRRLEVWHDPFSFMSNASGGKGWQPAQSLYAISSGGFWGLGLGQSNQKHGYLPEPQNDYIFAILCEELGFFGVICVIALFCVFAGRGYHIAKNSPNRFCALTVMGVTVQVIIQVMLNLAVVTNTIPSTGISLPFFSYGGTSLLILLAEMGVVLSISRYSYIQQG